MSEMKRYAMPIVPGGRLAVPQEAEKGFWCMYQDYAKLESENNQLRTERDRLADALDETLDRIRTFRIWFEDDYMGFADLPDDDPLLEETARLGLIGRAEEILEAYRRER